jgi:hypothetical protein
LIASAVLRRCHDGAGEHADSLVPARAAPPVRAVLADPQADLRQVEHLTGEMTQLLTVTKITLAASAHRRAMIDDLIRHSDLSEMPALMTGLTARLAP